MTIIMLIFVMALFAGAIGTPIAKKLAIKFGFIALPKSDRAHTTPTALLGGLAIYSAAISALLFITFFTTLSLGNRFRLPELFSILLGATLVAAIGLWDDNRPLPAWAKLGAQLIPAIIVFIAGVQVNLPLGVAPTWNQAINFAVTICWILFITNAINYLDNADGIAAMTTAAASASFMMIAILNGQQLVSILAAAVLGASLGFARYNLPLPKSTIFMGDSGSLFLGYLLAILGIKIRIPTNDIQITWMVPVIVLGFPIFDTVLVFISRTRRGISFFRGGVDHSTHRLSRLGLDGLSVAFAATIITGSLGMVAMFITQATLHEAYTVAGTLFVVAVYALWRLEFKASPALRTGEKGEKSTI